ncbi:hypothetical protein RRF57_010463 [Xylaria bambusicola]|uniref:Uncharacterized protein n=1 Tax=Xylaria bambusicola TaxID=326684 RepID=A0AAN7UL95_9PEZI
MSTSTFSYAQAAKGQLPAQSVTSQQSSNHSQTPSVTGNPNRDTNTTNVSTRDPSVAISASSHDIDSSRSARSTSVKPDDSQLNGTEITQDETNTVTSVTESVSSTKTGADQPSVDDGFKGTETRGRSTNTSSDASEQDEGKKGRKSKKSKSAEKGTEAGEEVEKAALPAKVELSEAPLPSVNIWVQRQREQAAKAKAIDQSTSSSISSAQIGTDSKTRPSHSESGEGSKISTNGKQGPKRDGESSRNNNNHGPKRTAPRGARTQDKELDTNFVATNPASWPTPETAAVNLKTQPQAQSEKLEKEDKEDSKTVKPKQKNEWVKMQNFVPSVKFETPINRGPRTGARTGAPRGGRDTTGNHQSAVSSNGKSLSFLLFLCDF